MTLAACVFDAYGTLFDVHSAVARHRDRIGPDAGAISALWRQRQLEYSWMRTMVGRHADFATVTADALDFALATYSVTDPGLRADLLAAYRRLRAYPEVASVLDRLRIAGFRTAILSNGSPDMLADAVSAAGLEGRFDQVLSVEAVGAFKADPRVYQLACDRLDLPPEAIAFQSSNAWDAAAGAAFGFQVHWINRADAPREYAWAGAVTELPDLTALADRLATRAVD